ncbi:MAG: mannitol dehydrogenase family protein, partial [Clostridia bacterium]|nr:mannitol dehydrogenase family protein [Clostridia bacterium]
MQLSYQGIQNKAAFEAAGIVLPRFDWKQMADYTAEHPVWVHFGAGNIFRGFIAVLQQRLLNAGMARSGIIAAETFDYDIIEKIYEPCDSMTLMVSLKPDGSTDKEVVASIARGIPACSANAEDWAALKAIFEHPELQMASFTITEKGYALTNVKGEIMPVVTEDIANGPDKARHAMAVVASMLYARYQAGAQPIAMVSMDNCSHNGEKLKSSVVTIVDGWVANGYCP